MPKPVKRIIFISRSKAMMARSSTKVIVKSRDRAMMAKSTKRTEEQDMEEMEDVESNHGLSHEQDSFHKDPKHGNDSNHNDNGGENTEEVGEGEDNDDTEESNSFEEEVVVFTEDQLDENERVLHKQLKIIDLDAPTLDELPKSALLVYAVHGLGTWGHGFFKALKAKYKCAYKTYKAYCMSAMNPRGRYPSRHTSGKCLIIPPDPKDGDDMVWHVCLFTSYGYGRRYRQRSGKDGRDTIGDQTRQALTDFRQKLKMGSDGLRTYPHWTPSGKHMKVITNRFNSGAFGIPWAATKWVVSDIFKDWSGSWEVIRKA
ncbi:hypothetical protein F5B21DRAFT_521846 [Xylaria acuta]|nr:hypothetical protein F5B21DRAFT_521846 [Xylaria acuta]